MTELQLFTKVDELARQLPQYVIQSTMKIRESGVIDYESYENNYVLPKMTMVAILHTLADEYLPPSITHKEKSEIRNMRLYL